MMMIQRPAAGSACPAPRARFVHLAPQLFHFEPLSRDVCTFLAELYTLFSLFILLELFDLSFKLPSVLTFNVQLIQQFVFGVTQRGDQTL